MNTLIIHSSKNKPPLHDATGAFIPEAMAFAAEHQVPMSNVLSLDCLQGVGARMSEVEFFLHAAGFRDIGMLTFFCHGWSGGIQTGHTLSKIPRLLAALASYPRDLRIMLYCCWTADGDGEVDNRPVGVATDGGFADKLRDGMLAAGFDGGWVDGHKTPGHTVKNPNVVRFLVDVKKDFDGDHDIQGGAYLVQPGSSRWGKWVHALQGPYRYRFPFATEEEIHAAIEML